MKKGIKKEKLLSQIGHKGPNRSTFVVVFAMLV